MIMILQTLLIKPQIRTTSMMRKLPTKHRNDITIGDIDNNNAKQAVDLGQNGNVKKTTTETDDDDVKESFHSS